MLQRPVERLQRKIEKENLWLFVLSSLRKKERYGNELRELIMRRFGFLVGIMTAYKILYLLEAEGYVKSKKEGKMIFYRITGKGNSELKKAKNLLNEYSRMI